MESLLKIIEIMSKNWVTIFIIITVIPVIRFALNCYMGIKIARINSPNKVFVSMRGIDGLEKTLEISSSEINLKDLQANLLLLENPKNELVMIQSKKEVA